MVRVKDVARADLGAKSEERHSRFNGAATAAIGIYQSPGANAVEVAQHVREVMDKLKQRFPEDLTYDVFFDTTVFVQSTIDEVIRSLVIAFVLVAIVVFLFLGKARSTLIPLVAVPVSIIGTFAVLLAAGYTANTVSLLALVLAIGIVVDDAIVVIENVERVIEEEPGLTIAAATKKAMAEITGPIIAITLVLLSVFVPVAFIPGVSGQLFRQFAVAVSTAMVISAINALTLSPALCSVLLKRGERSRGPMRRVLAAIDWARDGYVAIVGRLVRFAIFGVVAVAVVAAASFGLFSKTPRGFLPAEDQGVFFAAMRLPEGASLNRTEELVAQVESIIRPITGVQGVLSVSVSTHRLRGVVEQCLLRRRSSPISSAPRPTSGSMRSCGARPSSPPFRADRFPSTCRPSWVSAAQGLPVRPRSAAGTSPAVWRRPCTACRRQPATGARGRVQHVRRRHAPGLLEIDCDKRRSWAQGERHLQCPAVDAGRALCQRFQPVRPNPAGQHRVGRPLP